MRGMGGIHFPSLEREGAPPTLHRGGGGGGEQAFFAGLEVTRFPFFSSFGEGGGRRKKKSGMGVW